jgi:uncharacterized membrane protein
LVWAAIIEEIKVTTKSEQDDAIELEISDQELLMQSIELLPDQVIKNVELIANHQERYQQNATRHQRGLDAIASIFGQPQFLYFQIVFFIIWAVCSHLANLDILSKSFPLFDLREEGLSVVSLLISTGVLIYQTRQEKFSAERSHLILQLNLLTEQKITKLISLIEELRVDLPNVSNRDDLEATMMQQATDPQAILEVLQQSLDHSLIIPIVN